MVTFWQFCFLKIVIVYFVEPYNHLGAFKCLIVWLFLADFYNVCRERVNEESRVSERVSLQVANECIIYGLFSLQREKHLATKNLLDFPHEQLESYVPAKKNERNGFSIVVIGRAI